MGAYEGCQSDEDFLMFGSRDNSPASTTLKRNTKDSDIIVNGTFVISPLDRKIFLRNTVPATKCKATVSSENLCYQQVFYNENKIFT